MRWFAIAAIFSLATGTLLAETTSGYRVTIVDGDGALNSVSARTAHDSVIQVKDANRRSISGAYVEFDAPTSGASAAFANGSTHFATTTNTDGLAVASNLKNNGVPGSFALLVHVSYRGQNIGEAQVHETNVAGVVPKGLPQAPAGSSVSKDVNIPNSVIGVAMGDQFLVNGANTPSNANLSQGTRIQSLDKPTTLYLHNHCEYVVAPHSAVSIAPRLVMLESGSVRAKKFGDCRIGYGGLFVTAEPNADGVATLTGQSLQITAITGNAEVVNGAGDLISTVQAGTVSTFGTSAVSSGASIGGSGMSIKTDWLITGGLWVALAGFGIALDAILQPDSQEDAPDQSVGLRTPPAPPQLFRMPFTSAANVSGFFAK